MLHLRCFKESWIRLYGNTIAIVHLPSLIFSLIPSFSIKLSIYQLSYLLYIKQKIDENTGRQIFDILTKKASPNTPISIKTLTNLTKIDKY